MESLSQRVSTSTDSLTRADHLNDFRLPTTATAVDQVDGPRPDQASSQSSQSPVTLRATNGPGSIPADCIMDPRDWRESRQAPDAAVRDIISRGVLSLQTAELLYDFYRLHLDPFLYNVLDKRNTLQTVRASSSLLTAAICTIAALHCHDVDTLLFKTCLTEYSKESAVKSFSKNNNVDDVRAFCIGGFWLNDISWILVGAGESRVSACVDSQALTWSQRSASPPKSNSIQVCAQHYKVIETATRP